MNRGRYRLAPLFFGLLVVVLGTSLLVIFARSPYTHTNLTTGYNNAYTRTGQITLGTPGPLVRMGFKAANTSDQVALGRQLFFAVDCAACHGVRGQGSTFAPPIAGFDLETLTQRVRAGPGAMPAFSAQSPNAEELAAIEAYLTSLVPKR